MAGFRRTAVYTIPPAEPYAVNTILSGARDPGQDDGRDGDFWINTDTVAIFGPKTDGAWGDGTSLIGHACTNGTPPTAAQTSPDFGSLFR